jgi:exodeoxyribonuclease VII large subunit
LHQQLREARAAGRRRIGEERGLSARRLLVLKRKTEAALLDCRVRRVRELEQLRLALDAHDPQRTLERGYALVEHDDEPVTSAAQARAARELRLRFADGRVSVRTSKE